MTSTYDGEDTMEMEEGTSGTPGIRLYSERTRLKTSNLMKLLLIIILLVLIAFLILIYFSMKSQYKNIMEAQAHTYFEAEIRAEAQAEIAAKERISPLLRKNGEENSDPKIKAREGRVLISIMISYKELQRRELMRSMQIELYKNKSYPIDWKFFLGKVPDHYKKVIDDEIRLYNDIIILSHIEDTVKSSITRKFYEILKHVELEMQGYNLICKMDADAFINIPNLWPYYLEPNLNTQDPLIIARVWDYIEPGITFQPYQPHMNIAFVALSRKLVTMLIILYETHFKVLRGEHLGYLLSDEINLSHFLKEDIVTYKHIALPRNTSSHFNPNVTNLTALNHIIIPECIYVHEIKKEDEYVMVASVFDENGVDIDKANKVLKQAPYHKP